MYMLNIHSVYNSVYFLKKKLYLYICKEISILLNL